MNDLPELFPGQGWVQQTGRARPPNQNLVAFKG
jgi:hypothetical protein